MEKSKALSDVERARLAQKLDEDIDQYIESLAKDGRKRKEFDFDEWCKEIEQHPAFMTELKPDGNGEYSVDVQGLQALRYNDDGEDLVDLVNGLKNEGNTHFKHRNYRWSKDCYTNGIKLMCADRSLNSCLFSNRASAEKYLGNYRSAIRDCVFALRFDPSNLKAVCRGAECLLKLKHGVQCIRWLDKYAVDMEKYIPGGDGIPESVLSIYSVLYDLKNRAVERCGAEECEIRCQQEKLHEETAKKSVLLRALASRQLTFHPKINFDGADSFKWSMLDVNLPNIESPCRVYIDDSSVLYWPILVIYPEKIITDLLIDCCEESSLWEIVKKFIDQRIEEFEGKIFAESANYQLFLTLCYPKGDIFNIPRALTVGEMLSIENYVIERGLPSVYLCTNEYMFKHYRQISGNHYSLLR